ncbi:AraC family transcriptional regulator ligand-binding domain-containing protein [Nocardia sp. NPDC059240]|uniref:AraC family transcriptional regulator ligand-binding domain-containing protein n=1 Tax=Nocardia sp. NPDC059240 TaxID=3346786 RepID=UPI0036AC6A80
MGVQGDRPPRVRPAVATWYAMETGRRHGLSVAECLAGTGLRGMQLQEPGAVVLAGQEMRVIRNLIAYGGHERGTDGREADGRGDDGRGSDEPGVGTDQDVARALGEATGWWYHLGSAGVVGYAMVTSPTVREAVRLLPRYFAKTSVRFEPEFTETVDGLRVEFGDGERGSSVRAFLLARDLAAARAVVSALVSPFELIVETESGRGGFTVPPEILTRPARPPDAHTGLACVQQCELALDRRHRHTGTAAQVRRILLRTPAVAPTPAEVAHELGVSERGLHNRLAAQHLSFRSLADQIRQLLAAELLDLGVTASTVARMTGSTARTSLAPSYPERPGRSSGGAHDIPR